MLTATTRPRQCRSPGEVAAWLGFTAPSAVPMVALGHGVVAYREAIPAGVLAGYGAAQALPGPLFTFAAYLGTAMRRGALICLGAIFAPSFLPVAGTLLWWTALARLAAARRAMTGVNAAMVVLLGAAAGWAMKAYPR